MPWLILHRIIGEKGVAISCAMVNIAVEGILLVQKNIGMRIAAGRVCAAALALVFVYIDPAVVEAFGQNLDIILSRGCKASMMISFAFS